VIRANFYWSGAAISPPVGHQSINQCFALAICQLMVEIEVEVEVAVVVVVVLVVIQRNISTHWRQLESIDILYAVRSKRS
jgi:hypothetical protein